MDLKVNKFLRNWSKLNISNLLKRNHININDLMIFDLMIWLFINKMIKVIIYFIRLIMFGIRFTSLIRKSSQLCLNTVVLPKFQFAMANKYFIHYR